MKHAPQLENESERLSALHALDLLDTEAEERYDRLTRLLKQSLRVPVVLISLVDSERQWFKSKVGLETSQTARNISFCGHAIASDGLMIVPDAKQDPRFSDNPLVVSEPNIRFYAGYSLKTPSGFRIGTLCVIDFEPRDLTKEERQILTDIAQLVEAELAKDSPRRFLNLMLSGSASQKRAGAKPSRKQTEFFRKLTSRFSAASLALMVFSLGVWLLLGWKKNIEQAEYQSSQRKAVELASNIRGKIESELNARLHLTKGLAGLVVANRTVTEKNFQEFAAELGKNLPSVSSLQLAPDGIVTHVWPFEQHKKAIGHNLLSDPKRREEAQKAIDARAVWLAGPLNLIQGGVGLIGRYPIFIKSENQTEQFWGFSTILLDFDSFIAETAIKPQVGEFQIAIRKSAKDSSMPAFFGDDAVFNQSIAVSAITLPAGQWEVGVRLQQSSSEYLIWYAAMITLTLLIALAVYFLMRLPARFNNAVEQTSRALEQSEVRFRDAIEALPDGFVIFDKQDRLLACNSKYRDIYDKSGNIIVPGRSFSEMARDCYRLQQFKENPEETEEEFIARRLEEHHNSEKASEVQMADGRWIRQTERPIRGGGMVGLRVDITESKLKEKELAEAKDVAESASESKSQFLATVSHEVRTPMNVILGLLAILKSSKTLSKKEINYARTAHQSADQLLHLLNEILDISKVEAGKLSLDKMEFNAADVVQNVCELSQTKADDKGIELNVEIEKFKHPMVEGDERRFQQILMNLLSNAIKFTDQGWVKVTAKQICRSKQRCEVKVSVEDTGIGFSSSEAEKLFKPFSQIDSTAARKHEGTGLGLAITRELTHLMGGQIDAQGTKNHGAVFTVTIPFSVHAKVMVKKKQVSKSKQERISPRSLAILIAEDSPANQIVFSAMLIDTPHRVTMVDNGEKAVDALKQKAFDLVLMDIYMPEMNGVDATKAIRQLETNSHVPIVALTANAMKGDREKFIEAGMDDYLPKPIDKDKLISCINRWGEAVDEKRHTKKAS